MVAWAAAWNGNTNTDSQWGFKSPLFHTVALGTAVLINWRPAFPFTSFLASFSLFSLDLRLDPLGLIWLAALAKKALLTSHSGSCGTQKIKKARGSRRLWDQTNIHHFFSWILLVLQVIISSCISRLPTSSLGLSWLFRRPPLVPEGAVLGLDMDSGKAAGTSSSSFSASWSSSSTTSSTSESLSSSSDSAPPSSSSSSSCAPWHRWTLLKVIFQLLGLKLNSRQRRY